MEILHLSDITWVRGNRTILEHVNWRIRANEHWALLGLNGSGKTSLLQIISGYQWPTQGSVTVLGMRYGSVDVREVRKHIGWVSSAIASRFEADASLDKAYEVVISGKYGSIGLWQPPTDEDRQDALHALEQVSLLHLADAPFNTLSQGERQRLFIARAFMAKPKLLVLDEPCTGLDIRARELLLSSLERTQKNGDGPTIIYVTHHVEEILPFISHALVMDEGRVAASGAKQAVLTDDVLRNAFHVDVRTTWENQRVWLTVR
ncbi:putative ABC transporter ATP-binding protein YlmA [Alicyclobacillus hesperidum subsp. aegles]|uniref:ABC transporter ATP-binding protein n=1 Tax=Alicyclobacillus hesperidum TaxID=89784 RepID=UPI0007191C0B|nr:ABC transporter ATP-binding protein [Alicyclobacillus hesperidum]KRW90947.1 molybdenum ABC transporter ATP-binding protein [Alicyclobacillus tengchongensis]GLG01652.1 putative ABC transporter ATP-binding protein YlmA [Alicyclobacillus hesperidum subsp. aegles]